MIEFPVRPIIAALGATLLVACSDGNNNNNKVTPPPPPPPPPEPTYQVEIVWTEYGIPHVTANDWASLAYGNAYAASQLNYCPIMRSVVDAKGNSAQYFGDEGDLDLDLVMKLLNDEEAAQRMFDGVPEYVQQTFIGYAAGMNRYLADTGLDNLAEGIDGCRGAPWVSQVTALDLVQHAHKSTLRASSTPLAGFTVAASLDNAVTMTLPAGISASEQLVATLDKDSVEAALDMPKASEIGSNAYAVGADASQTSSGILLGNPHFPWKGAERFFMFHLTLPGEYDVMGAATLGGQRPLIGFNGNLAWTHTVSTGTRFTLYELELNPDNKMQYIYDGEIRDIESRTVSTQKLQADGSVDTVEHTFYLSHYGPIMDLGTISPLLAGWPNAVGTLLTYRDANLENMRGVEQWFRMGQAANVDEFKQALRSVGLPFTNTLAVDRYGDALYSDISVVPNVSINKYNNCIRGALQTLLTERGLVTMDGADSACEWGNDPDTAKGILGYDNLPKLETRNYAANANDSYWLAHPEQLLTGFSPLIGKEEVPQRFRTRHTFDMAEKRLAGTDGLGDPGFNIDNIRQMMYQATNHAAELVLPEVIEICSSVSDWSAYSANPGEAASACSVLADWDGAHRVDSVGGHVFYEFWKASDTDIFWTVPFDPADPVYTPRDLDTGDEAVVEAVKQSFADGVDTLVAAGIGMDTPWSEVQFSEKNGTRYGIHGGDRSMMFSVIRSELIDGEGYSDIFTGNSYIQAVTWDESDCPDAYAVLTFSQSTDPASPHYEDSTALYSDSKWIDMPYCEAARDAQEIGRMTLEE